MEDKMGNELAVVSNKEGRLAPLPEFSNEQTRILAETVAKGCDQNELGFFLNVCKLKRLDPFSGQVHCVKRWDSDAGREKMAIQVGIDGFRVIAVRTGELAGISEPEYDSEDGQHPLWARVTVYRYGRGDEKIPYTAKARWSEYVQTKKDGNPNRMWAKMPYIMLAKCSEAMALRKAFPDELSGMYSEEEMGQADNEGTTTPGSLGPKPPVTMPRSTDEKKEPGKAAPQQGKAETVKPPAQPQAAQQTAPQEISGEIEKASPGKGAQEGALWLVVNKKIICVPKDKVDAEMVPGAKVLVMVVPIKGGTVEKYEATSVEMVVPPAEDGIIDAEVTDVPDKASHEEYIKDLGNDLFGAEKPKAQTTMEAPGAKEETKKTTKPGTAGPARATRLKMLIRQNEKNTGFTFGHLEKYKKMLGVEHTEELPCPPKGSDAFNAYDQACAMAVGEEDWHQVMDE